MPNNSPMEITYLGHAGFLVTTAEAIVVMDPWLSPGGAFDAAWFQFPRNHHMAAFVQEKLQDRRRKKYVYISHEHKDHFDPVFLRSLCSRDFCFVAPRFRRSALRELLSTISCEGVITCADGECVQIPGGSITLYVDDSEVNRDSAVLMRAAGRTFLNFNDCKLYDRASAIAHCEGPIDVYTCQFSGATWHPTCYEYSRQDYERISHKKQFTKFEAVVRSINTLQPRVYVPSAGPACFLDPSLMHINFEPVNIFPHAWTFLDYLQKRRPGTSACYMVPGDVLDAASAELSMEAKQRVCAESYEKNIADYAADYAEYFKMRRLRHSHVVPRDVLNELREVLENKLSRLTLAERIKVPLYFVLSDAPECALQVSFCERKVTLGQGDRIESYYSISAPSWEVSRVLDGLLTWEDFALTFRMRLSRSPDLYQALIQAFLIMEQEDLDPFCAKVLDLESRSERIVVGSGSKYIVDRYCPHQAGDLRNAWIEDGRYLTCPRHRWQFDLQNGGRCVTNETSIHAICIEDD